MRSKASKTRVKACICFFMKKISGEIIVIKRDKSVKKRKSSISIPNSVLQVQHMKLTAVKYYCSDLSNPPQRAFAIRVSMNRVIFFIYGES